MALGRNSPECSAGRRDLRDRSISGTKLKSRPGIQSVRAGSSAATSTFCSASRSTASRATTQYPYPEAMRHEGGLWTVQAKEAVNDMDLGLSPSSAT